MSGVRTITRMGSPYPKDLVPLTTHGNIATTMPTKQKDLRRTSAITVALGSIGAVASIAIGSLLVLGTTVLAMAAWLGRLWVIDRYRSE